MTIGRVIAASAVLATVFCSPLNASAQGVGPNWVPEAKIRSALERRNQFYGDVPSAVNCARTRGVAEALICKNPYLRQAELLNNRAAAYAEENATKREVNHRAFRAGLPRNCRTEQCIYDFFKGASNDSLGGDSPYQQQ